VGTCRGAGDEWLGVADAGEGSGGQHGAESSDARNGPGELEAVEVDGVADKLRARRRARRRASPRSQIQLRRQRCWSSSTHMALVLEHPHASHPVGEMEGSRVGAG
jgi:hypothetical protein